MQVVPSFIIVFAGAYQLHALSVRMVWYIHIFLMRRETLMKQCLEWMLVAHNYGACGFHKPEGILICVCSWTKGDHWSGICRGV